VSFFGTLKSEFFDLNQFESIEQLQVGIRQPLLVFGKLGQVLANSWPIQTG
jgi:hypothetical protein